MFFVYILEALESKKYYIGQTENLEERVKKHNQGKNLSTKYYIPWRLKWSKEFETRSEAVKIEKKLKGIKKRIGIEKFVVENGFSGCGAVGPVPPCGTRILEKSENQRFSIFRD
jgi:putative endonuclease